MDASEAVMMDPYRDMGLFGPEWAVLWRGGAGGGPDEEARLQLVQRQSKEVVQALCMQRVWGEGQSG